MRGIGLDNARGSPSLSIVLCMIQQTIDSAQMSHRLWQCTDRSTWCYNTVRT